MQDAVWYFAYGSNMDMTRLYDARLKPRGVPVTERALGQLDGWTLAFNKPWSKFSGGGAANIMPKEGAITFGTLNLMPSSGLDILDHYEGVAGGHYVRRTLSVMQVGTGEPVEAVAYIAERDLDPALIPPRFYLDHLLAGRDLLPPGYTRWLEGHPVLPIHAEL